MTPQQLRNSILQMAIEGKLTEQRAEDGNASDLLKEIKAEKAKLIAEKKIKKEKSLPEISEDEIPFEIPDNWIWCRLGEIFIKDIGGGTPSKDNSKFWNGTIPWMSVKDFSHAQNNVVEDTIDHITFEGVENSATNIIDTSAIILCVRMGLGRYAKISQPTAINQDLRAFWLSDNIVESYFLRFYSAINISGTGTTVKGIKRNELLELLFPLPPLAEQKRIVARLEEILLLVDEYEKAYNELQELNKKFPDNLKNSLLQMAIEGKLVEQRAEDGNARDLLKEIQAEKAKLIAEKKIKKEKPLPEINEDEIPFEIPDNWVWVRLRDIVYNGGQKRPTDRFCYIDIGSIDNVHQVLNSKENIIEAKEAPSRARKITHYGDVLYSTVRPYLHNMCIVDKEFTCEAIASTGFAVMTCVESCYNKYLFYYLLSPAFDLYANSNENAKGVAYPAINDERLYKAVVPLPPLAEQKRIVAKLEQLLPLCDELSKEYK